MNAQCTNTDGSYTCGCLDGYSGDGKNCTCLRLRACTWLYNVFMWRVLFPLYILLLFLKIKIFTVTITFKDNN